MSVAADVGGRRAVRIEEVIAVLDEVGHDPAIVCAREGEALPVLWCNAAMAQATGRDAADLHGAGFTTLLGSEADAELGYWLAAALAAGRRFRGMLPFRADAGATLWGECQASPFGTGSDGGCAYWVFLIRDITPDMDLRDALAGAKAEAERMRTRLWAAIEAAPDAFALYDADDRLVMFNQRYRALYGESTRALTLGTRFEDILREGVARGQYPDAEGREEEWIAARLAQHREPRGPIEQELPGDRHLQIREQRTPEGDTVGFRIDVTELKRQSRMLESQARALAEQMERMRELSRTDTLTGLGNRRGLDLQMRAMAERPPPPGQGRAFLHIDLDRFKQINDMSGHAAGDRVLQEVAGILRRSVRPEDYVARVGGDEFAILIEAEEVARVADGVAGRVIAACRLPVFHDGVACRFGASIGIAIAPASGATEGLMENADIALYAAKAQGRNRAARFTSDLRRAAEDRKRLGDDLLRALEGGEQIRAWYHPQIRAEDGAVAGVEALVRWHHPERGVLPPDAFLDVADDLDVTAEIDRRILRAALDTAASLAARGQAVPKVSVNVGYGRLARADLSAEVARLAPLPCRVAFELLETIDFDRDGGELMWTIDALREQGCEIEIDDFGSGRASLSTLLQLRPERLKIDRRLVAALDGEGEGGSPLVRAIADMGRALGIRLSAEGVETQAQAAALRGLGCDVLQGHLFAPPLEADGLAEWLARRGAAPASSPA
jgi:diguanylate cyclase (GGDEF)-like protein